MQNKTHFTWEGKMKKKALILLCVFLLTGCGKIQVQDVSVEAGEEISSNLSDYMDVTDLDEADVSLDIDTVDAEKPGDYEASVSYKNKKYPFTVHVVDTIAPEAEKTEDYMICQPGTLIASDYVKNVKDVTETTVGFLSFEKREDLKIMTDDEIKEDAVDTEETDVFREEMTFEEEKDIAEEGIYDAKVAVKDTSGNMRIFGCSFYIDGTGPDLPEHEDETIQINDVNGAFVPDLDEYYCTDNFDPAEQVVEETTVDYESQNYYINDDGKTVEDVKIIIESKDRAGNESTRSWIITAVNSYDYMADIMKSLENTNTAVFNEPAATSDGFDRAKAEEAFALVNQKRTENGVGALTWNESMYELACVRAQECSQKFSHERPDGSYVPYGENLAGNYKSLNNLINAWMNSEGHKNNLLNAKWSSGAMGCYSDGKTYYWANLFD